MTAPQTGDLVSVHIRDAKVDEILADGNISIRIGDGSYIWIGEAPDVTIVVTRRRSPMTMPQAGERIMADPSRGEVPGCRECLNARLRGVDNYCDHPRTFDEWRNRQERRHIMTTWYISYHCVKEDDEGNPVSGYGSTMFAGPMGTKENVLGAAEAIRNYLNAQHVVIINWVELPDEPDVVPVVTPAEENAADELGELGRELAGAECA